MKMESKTVNSHKIERRERIESIDILKGFSIFFIIGAHIAPIWLISNDIWMYEIIYIFYFSTVGSANFIMLSGLNLTLSFRLKKESGWSNRQIYVHTLKRLSILLLISVLYNYLMTIIVYGLTGVSWYDFYAWYIFQAIAVSVIITMFMLRIKNIYRVVIGFFIIIMADSIYLFFNSMGPIGQFFNHLFYYPFPAVFWSFPLIPYLSCALIGSVLGNYFYQIKYGKKFTTDKQKRQKLMGKLVIYLLLFGIFFIFIAVIFGSGYPSDPTSVWYVVAMSHTSDLNTAPFFNFSSIPFFLLPNHWTYMFYSLGSNFILLSLFTYYSDYKRRKNFLFNSLSFAGKFSFSIFVYHHIGMIFFPNTFNYIFIWPAWVGYAILFIFFIWIIVKKFNGVGTVEWIMVAITMKKKHK
ncbi:MAG: heparan-alpha-glucosaminide N-acetyltransferase domain-containing protein [Candidatus Helarchaeota archaeon]